MAVPASRGGVRQGRGGQSKLDGNPNVGRRASQVQPKLPDSSWLPMKLYKTSGNKETRTINLKRGTYRVIVIANYGYPGVTCAEVYLKR
jgi:hypothetical protein